MSGSHLCEQTLHAFTGWYPRLCASEIAALVEVHNPMNSNSSALSNSAQSSAWTT